MTDLVIFRGRFTSKCFYYKTFRIELRCEWVNTKNLDFFHGMLLHSYVAKVSILISLSHILQTVITRLQI